MACCMPILAVAGGETKRIVEEAECGVCCKLGDVDELIKCIDMLMHEDTKIMRERTSVYFSKHFVKSRLMDEMDECLKK